MNAICASEDFDFFMEPSFSRRRDHKWKIPDQSGPNIGRHVKIILTPPFPLLVVLCWLSAAINGRRPRPECPGFDRPDPRRGGADTGWRRSSPRKVAQRDRGRDLNASHGVLGTNIRQRYGSLSQTHESQATELTQLVFRQASGVSLRYARELRG